MCNQLVRGIYGSRLRKLVFADLTGLPLAGCSIHGDTEILSGFITSLLDCFKNCLNRIFIGL